VLFVVSLVATRSDFASPAFGLPDAGVVESPV